MHLKPNICVFTQTGSCACQCHGSWQCILSEIVTSPYPCYFLKLKSTYKRRRGGREGGEGEKEGRERRRGGREEGEGEKEGRERRRGGREGGEGEKEGRERRRGEREGGEREKEGRERRRGGREGGEGEKEGRERRRGGREGGEGEQTCHQALTLVTFLKLKSTYKDCIL